MLGALAAGGWAMTQEPPKREHWEKLTQREQRPTPKQDRAAVPDRVEAPPAQITTAAIPKPQRVDPAPQMRPPAATSPTHFTTEKVRMREQPSTDSAVVTMLKGGQTLSVTGSDGKWRHVTVGDKVGWVHGDYLAAGSPPPVTLAAAPRPTVDVGAPQTGPDKATPRPVSVPAKDGIWGSLRPIRPPQQSDCQCPYDLMLSGKQCGEHSAYALGKGAECYF